MNRIRNIIDYIYYERSKIITIIITLIISIPFVLFIFNSSNNKKEEIVLSDNKVIEEEEKNDNKKVIVDIKGEVNNPGCYEINEDKRVQDVIDLAGGLTSNASTSNINLSSKVYDEMVIVINKKEDTDSTIESAPSINISTESNKVVKSNGKVSINNAGIEELITLNGIKEARAKKIIEYRETNGPFKSIEEIMNVSGIGEGIFAKIKDYITL